MSQLRNRAEEPVRVLVTNCVLLNGGDAAIVEATIETLRDLIDRPVEFKVLDQQPDVAGRLFPHLDVGPWPWHIFGGGRTRPARVLAIARGLAAGRRVPSRYEERAVVADYRAADLVLSKGGTYLVEQYRLAPHLFDFRLARSLRRPLVLAPQSLGPFKTRLNRIAVPRLLRDATIFVRDERSLRHLEQLGLRGQLAADSAFLWADASALSASQLRSLPDPPRVAVSVRDWQFADGTARYRRALAALVSHLVRQHEAAVTFISTCQGVPEYVTDDARLAEEIVDQLPADVAGRVELNSDWHRPRDLQQLLAGFDVVVATRMHAAILALNGGVPVFPIACEFKTSELFARLGLGDAVQDAQTMTPASIVEGFDRFLEELPARRATLFDAVERESASAFEAMRQIATLAQASGSAPGGATRSARRH